MDWINLHTSILDSEEFLGEEPVNQATWLKLLRYCIGQENSGIIKDCLNWKDRKWQQIVRVTQAETQAESALWAWVEDSLQIMFYPLEKEAIVKGARQGGRSKTQAKTQASKENGKGGGRPKNPRQTQAKTQQKGREGNGMEQEGNGNTEGVCESGLLEIQKPETNIPEILNLYPRRERMAEAATEIRKHIQNGVHPEAIIAGTRAIAAVITQMPSRHLNKFVPNALNFFKDRRWEDDPQTWLRNATGPNGSTTTPELSLGGRTANVIKIPNTTHA